MIVENCRLEYLGGESNSFLTKRDIYKSLIKRSILTHPLLWIQLQVPLDLITSPLVLAYHYVLVN